MKRNTMLLVRLLTALSLLIGGYAALNGLSRTAARAGTELVRNTCFRDGATQWEWLDTTTVTAADCQLRADVAAGTPYFYDAVINQEHIPLSAGTTYRLSFTAWASAPKTIVTKIMVVASPTPPYPSALIESTGLTAAPRRFTYTVTPDADIANAAISYQVGGYPDAWSFHLAHVSLRAQ